MMYKKFEFIKKNFLLFSVFFFISFIIGYDSLNRFNHSDLISKGGTLSDISTYKRTVEVGFVGLYEEKRIAPRILTPLLAHYVNKIFKGKLRSWDSVFFSLLFVNSIFVALTCLLMMSYLVYLKIGITIAPQLFFLGSFGVSALYLSGLIDSSLSFFIFLNIYSILNKKYLNVILTSIILSIAKETSFIYLAIVFGAYLINELIFKKKIILKEFFILVVSFFLNVSIINFYCLYFLELNIFDYIVFIQEGGGSMYYEQKFIDIFKFFIFLIPFIFFLPYGLKIVEKKFLYLFFTIFIFHMIFLQFIINLDGNGMGRYMFNLSGPIFCLISGIGFQKYLSKN